MEFTTKNTLTLPLALSPPSIGGPDDILSQDAVVEEQAWTSPDDSSFEEMPYETDQGNDEDHVNIFYRVLTSHVMPFFLLLQWVLEVYYDDDDEATEDIGWGVLLLNVGLFCVLAPFYRKAVEHNLWGLLTPVIFLTVADALVLFHLPTFAYWTMAGGLLGMAGAVAFDYFKRGKEEQETFINEREWMLNP